MPRAIRLASIVTALALILLGLVLPPGQGGRMATDGPTGTDAGLYQRIVARVQAGEPYHAAAIAEQRAHDYPVKPFVTVRPPALAWLIAKIGWPGASALLLALTVAACLAFTLALRAAATSAAEWLPAAALSALGAFLLGQPSMTMWHDIWTALLLMLALGLWRPHRAWPAVLAGLAAALIRELAIPFLLAMGFMALIDRRPREATLWAGALLVAGVALALHAHAVAALVLPGDPASQGWSGGGGWPLLLAMLRQTSLFGLLPAPAIMTAILTPLALLGWIARGDALGRRVSLMLAGYGAMLMLFARPDNFYWSALIAPILPAGLAFLPRLRRTTPST